MCLQIYSKVKTLTQVCEDKGNKVMVLLSSGRNVAVVRTRCHCRQYVVSASSGCDAGVIGTRMSMSSGRGVVSTGCVCPCRRDAVLASLGRGRCRRDAVSVSSGCGVGVVGMWCRSHWDTVLASSGGGVSVGIIRRQGASSWPFACGLPYSDT